MGASGDVGYPEHIHERRRLDRRNVFGLNYTEGDGAASAVAKAAAGAGVPTTAESPTEAARLLAMFHAAGLNNVQALAAAAAAMAVTGPGAPGGSSREEGAAPRG